MDNLTKLGAVVAICLAFTIASYNIRTAYIAKVTGDASVAKNCFADEGRD